MTESASPLFIQSVGTGLNVLLAFDSKRSSMNLPEIAVAAGITKSAAQRFAFTLQALGFLRKDPTTKRYSLSSQTLDFGYRYLLSSALIDRANPYLLELNRHSRETITMSEPNGAELVVIARFPSTEHSIVHIPVGRRLPMYCTASGRAYLSALGEEEAAAILERTERVKFTPNTVTEVDKLMEMLAESRETGYAYAEQELYRTDLNLAVPIHDVSGRPVAALNISASTSRWSPEKMREEMVPLLLDTAHLISTTPPTARALEPFHRGYGVEDEVMKGKPKTKAAKP